MEIDIICLGLIEVGVLFFVLGVEVLFNVMMLYCFGLVWLFLFDVYGCVLDWIIWQDVVCFYVCEVVVWMFGDFCLYIYGGINCFSGLQSGMDLYLIIVVRGYVCFCVIDLMLNLINQVLFVCDVYLCMYCGQQFICFMFICDYVMLLFKGGLDCWENVVIVCFYCNLCKSDCILQQVGMFLLVVFYWFSWIEYLILFNCNILVDQMVFLKVQLFKCLKLSI